MDGEGAVAYGPMETTLVVKLIASIIGEVALIVGVCMESIPIKRAIGQEEIL